MDIKHTNQMTMKELVEQLEYLAGYDDPDVQRYLQNIHNEIQYRLSIEEQ